MQSCAFFGFIHVPLICDAHSVSDFVRISFGAQLCFNVLFAVCSGAQSSALSVVMCVAFICDAQFPLDFVRISFGVQLSFTKRRAARMIEVIVNYTV